MSDPGNQYQNLIRTAKACLVEGGVLPNSLDSLAHMAGVDIQDVRASFKTVEALREGLIYDSVILLNDALRQGIIESDPKSPDAQLRSLARSYGEWAQQNPAQFAMLAEGLVGEIKPDTALYRFTLSIRDLFKRKLHEMVDVGILAEGTDIDRIVLLLHCVIRGANSVFVGRANDLWIQDDTRSYGNLAQDVFDQFMDGVIALHGKKPAAK